MGGTGIVSMPGYGFMLSGLELGPTGDNFDYWYNNERENGSSDFMAWYSGEDEVQQAIDYGGFAYTGMDGEWYADYLNGENNYMEYNLMGLAWDAGRGNTSYGAMFDGPGQGGEGEPLTYTVKKGDYLSTIANEVYGGRVTVEQLMNANKIITGVRTDGSEFPLIYPGQVLNIPYYAQPGFMDSKFVKGVGIGINILFDYFMKPVFGPFIDNPYLIPNGDPYPPPDPYN